MFRTLFVAAMVLAATALAAAAGTITLTVGPSQQFSTIAGAVSAANGDSNPANYYVISVAPGTYTNDTASVSRPMTIEAAQPGSAVILNQTQDLANQKGILISLAELTVDGLTFQGAHISASLGANGAGIRAEQGSQNYVLTVRNSRFVANQTALLTDVNFPLDVVFVNNVLINNGNGNTSSLTHGIYIGSNNRSLTAIGNEICGTIVGHDIKSRATINVIENNMLYDGAADPNQPGCNTGSASYALDLPNGGVALVSGNAMIQGAATQNANIFAYGEEGLAYPVNSLAFMNNAMQSAVSGATGIYDPNAVPVVGSGNSFAPSITTVVNPASANQLTGGSNGAHTVIVGLAEDAYLGDAIAAISVDGGPAQNVTVTAQRSAGKTQDVSIPLSGGTHTISVKFLNDAWGGSASTDRNLYVIYVKYDGNAVQPGMGALYRTGDVFTQTVP